MTGPSARLSQFPCRAVLFDFGGTLMPSRCIDEAFREAAVVFGRLAGIRGDDAAQRLNEAQRRAASDVVPGITGRRYYLHRDLFRSIWAQTARVLQVALTAEQVEQVDAAMLAAALSRAELMPGAMETLGELRARGYLLSIVSNSDEDDLRALLNALRLDNFFDDVLSSEAARSCKPDSAIFEQSLSRLRCPAAQAVFVGDTPANDIDGAAATGMRTVLITGEQAWATHGIPSRYSPDHVITALPELLQFL